MTVEEFLIKLSKNNHKWVAYNGHDNENYICIKCDEKSILAYDGCACISDEEAIIKKLLE